MQANELTRRSFLGASALLALGALMPRRARAIGAASQVDVAQLVYSGGNWRPRPTALRRLVWEVHKRTAVDTSLEPSQVKPNAPALAASPLAYLAGDRPFPEWSEPERDGLTRFLRLGGTLIVDPAHTPDGDAPGFEHSVDVLLERALPDVPAAPIEPGHVIFRAFYQLPRAVGRIEGPPGLTGHAIGGRFAVIRTHHDLGGAWGRDNLGNWQYEVVPGGARQRESAFRLGINLVLYALCLDYKNEEPHRRFGAAGAAGD